MMRTREKMPPADGPAARNEKRRLEASGRMKKYPAWCQVTWKDVGITLGILFVATIAAYIYDRLTAQTMNVIMFYTLAILLVSRTTQGYIPGIAAAFLSVFAVNYLFTYPYWKLNFMLDGYPVTFFCMMVVAVLTSMATSHMKKQAKELSEREKLLAEAEKEKMRANLLRAVSHDLRTPLTGIIGASSSYLENEERLTDQEKREMVRHIGEDADWLLNMVENLLTVTRIQNDTDDKVKKTSEVVEEVVSEALQRLQKRLPDTRVRVSMPDDFLMLAMDPTLIEQVLINLIENAAVHSGSTDPVDLVIKDEPEFVSFSVRDYGTGITKEQLPHIFEGSQVSSLSSDGHRGIGIGLSICKTIIRAHGGDITAVNHGKGAEFIFTLPKEKEE